MKKVAIFGLMTACMLAAATVQAKKQEKSFDAKGFDGIRTETPTCIRYTQGKDYSVKATGTEEEIRNLSVTVVNGTLVVKSAIKEHKSADAVEMEITAPEINALELGAVSEFAAESMKAGKFRLRSEGVSSFKCKKLVCDSYASKTSGVSSIQAEVETRTAQLDCSGVDSSRLKFLCERMAADCSGVCNLQLDFKGDDMKLEGSGTGDVRLHVDCKRLKAQTSGACRLTLSGTADKTEVNSSGLSNIDMTELNRF